MKLIGFTGSVDKTDLVMYIAKLLSSMGQKTIFIDATTTQKTRYIIPTIGNMVEQNQYVVERDGVDFAVGFTNMLELKKFLLSKGEDFTDYEYVIVDTDNNDMCEEYDLKNANHLFFVSSYDKFHVIKGIELLKYMCAMKRKTDVEAKLSLTRIIYYSEINTADARLLDNLTESLPITWIHNPINYPYDSGDLSVNIQNQYGNKIDFKNLTKMYKDAISETVMTITGEDKNALKKAIKNIEKAGFFK